MSNPQNILAKYRSYSYHHILIACDNEAAARYIRESNRLSTFREIGQARGVAIQEDKLVQVSTTDESTGEVNRTQVGAYVVILNGMIDTSFVVRDVEWFTTTAASTDQHDRFTSIAVEGKMTVEEPRGVRFLNALNGACDLLQTDATGVIWLLKTIFIGHTDDGRTEPIVDLRPLEFMIYDVVGTFDITGGVYDIEFAGANNGASRFPQFSRISENITFEPKSENKADNRLTSVMNTLETRMNELSRKNRSCVIQALKNAYRTGPVTTAVDVSELEKLRLVEYVIRLDPPYDDDRYIIDSATDQEKNEAKPESPPVFAFGPEHTIEQAIRHTMDRCSRVLKDRTEPDDNGITYTWKIHSEITMVGKGTINPITNSESDQNIVLVVYEIKQFPEVTNKTIEALLASPDEAPNQETKEATQRRINENLIEFDYFFTGKNTDIINFDIKMELGLAFLQTIGSTNNLETGTNQILGTEQINAVVMTMDENNKGNPTAKPKILLRPKTPIFPATNTRNIRTRNVRGALDSTLFHAMLSKHAALESVEAFITIHGNPYLMSQTNKRSSDRARESNVTDESDEARSVNILQNWGFVPGVAKVNIFMPTSADTPSSSARFDREKFWYDGFYYLYGIDHKFNEGQFTQDLHLIAMPNESFLQNTQTADITECGIQQTKEDTSSDEEPTAEEAKAKSKTSFRQTASGI